MVVLIIVYSCSRDGSSSSSRSNRINSSRSSDCSSSSTMFSYN